MPVYPQFIIPLLLNYFSLTGKKYSSNWKNKTPIYTKLFFKCYLIICSDTDFQTHFLPVLVGVSV